MRCRRTSDDQDGPVRGDNEAAAASACAAGAETASTVRASASGTSGTYLGRQRSAARGAVVVGAVILLRLRVHRNLSLTSIPPWPM